MKEYVKCTKPFCFRKLDNCFKTDVKDAEKCCYFCNEKENCDIQCGHSKEQEVKNELN